MMYLFFDTETTGLPKSFKAPLDEFDNWPRLVQLSWLIYDQDKNFVKEGDYIIKPSGFKIPYFVSKIHGISTKHALEHGTELNIVLEEFIEDLEKCSHVIAHNIDFDTKIVGSELLRNGFSNFLENKEYYCTMKKGVNVCKIPSRTRGFKFPKLQELHNKLFNESFENRHNALADVKACARCYWEIKKLEEIVVE